MTQGNVVVGVICHLRLCTLQNANSLLALTHGDKRQPVAVVAVGHARVELDCLLEVGEREVVEFGSSKIVCLQPKGIPETDVSSCISGVKPDRRVEQFNCCFHRGDSSPKQF